MSYGVIKSIIALLAFLVAGGIFVLRLYQLLWDNMRRGQPSGPFRQWGKRIEGLVVYVAAQFRLFRFLVPGTAHFFIFWGFLILSLTILQAIIEGLVAFTNPHFVLPLIGEFGPLALLQDLFAVFVVIAVINGLYLRVVADPERYKGSHKNQGVMVLMFIFTIMLSVLVINGIRINLGEDPISVWRPISALVGRMFAGLSEGSQNVIEEVAYWIHLGVVLVFLTELPGGKHFHVVTSVFAVALRNLEPPGRLPPAPEFNGDIGVTWPDADSDKNHLAGCFPGDGGEARSFQPDQLPQHETVYAMTVHKSQGSEFDEVLFVLPDRDFPILTRELIYTALTRARKKISIWGNREIIQNAMVRRIERTSGLRDALWGVDHRCQRTEIRKQRTEGATEGD